MIIIIKYIQERFKIWIYFPLCFLLSIGSEVSGLYNLNRTEILQRIITALLLLLWFRLWDDLCSMKKDRIRSPERITVNPFYTRSLWIWLFVLSVISFSLILIFYGFIMTIIMIIFSAIFIVIYLFHEKLNQLHYDLLVLIKYPVIAFTVSSATSPLKDKIIPLLIIYLITLVYDVFHDREHLSDPKYLRTGFSAWIILIIGFASQILTHSDNSNFNVIKISILFFCMGLFLLTLFIKNVRSFKIIPFANGILYLGILAVPV